MEHLLTYLRFKKILQFFLALLHLVSLLQIIKKKKSVLNYLNLQKM